MDYAFETSLNTSSDLVVWHCSWCWCMLLLVSSQSGRPLESPFTRVPIFWSDHFTTPDWSLHFSPTAGASFLKDSAESCYDSQLSWSPFHSASAQGCIEPFVTVIQPGIEAFFLQVVESLIVLKDTFNCITSDSPPSIAESLITNPTGRFFELDSVKGSFSLY